MSTRVAGFAWGAGAQGEGKPGECILDAATVVVWSHCVIVCLHCKDDASMMSL